MIYHVSHETTYHYPYDVSISHNLLHLTARAAPRQTRLSDELTFSVPPAVTSHQSDYFGNRVTSFIVQVPHRRLCVRAVNVVDVHPPATPDPASTTPWEEVRRALPAGRDPATLDAYQFTFDSP